MNTLEKIDNKEMLIKPYNDLVSKVQNFDVKSATKGELETIEKDGKKAFADVKKILDDELANVLLPVRKEIDERNETFKIKKNNNIERVNNMVKKHLEKTPIPFDLFVDKSWYNKSFEKDEALDDAIRLKMNDVKNEVSLLRQLNATDEQMKIFYNTLMLSKCIVRNETFCIEASAFELDMLMDWLDKNGISYTKR